MRQAKLVVSYRLKSDMGKSLTSTLITDSCTCGGNETNEANWREISDRNVSEGILNINF